MTHLPEPAHEALEPVALTSKYAKAVVAILTAATTALLAATTDDHISGDEVGSIALQIVIAFGVFVVPNLPAGPGRYLKLAVALVGAGLQAAIPLLGDDVYTPDGWLLVLIAALGAVSVGIIPNAPDPLLEETPRRPRPVTPPY